ncbi:beta-ketoacyl synthase [Mycolicibacterium phlei]|jgi:hypothetical protein|nr:hypothetical protein [Mycolicibacterium phlei]AMO61659.1 Phthiocerol/phenolphthiocerol synthesis polyketide synthase type I PpsE [Mycolicibacterium phlei]KXW76449.1 hypothetical protein JL15_16810 [Mycolicibacterium phlei DSM 43071]STZ18883.1 beta-ketoacyl synthase [Mycolicibacterium phlei]VEG09766.1 beta-ketoacyl synthase [Mycobacteroides chelonae]
MVAPYTVPSVAAADQLLGDLALATVRIADYDPADAHGAAAMVKVETPVSEELAAELDGATEWLGVPTDEILLAALTRTIARTLGEGVVRIDIASNRGSLLDAVPLPCVGPQRATAAEVLSAVHRALAGATESVAAENSEIYFNLVGEAPAGSAAVSDTPPGLGHALELRVYRADGDLRIDWWYDTSRFEGYTVVELSEQFPLAIVEIASDALPVS